MSPAIVLRRALQNVALTILSFGLICFSVVLSCPQAAFATDLTPKARTPVGTFPDDEFDSATSVNAFEDYRHVISALLVQGDFGDLDCLADAARAGKSRFAGGSWKLRHIYLSGSAPDAGHATDEDWRQHLDLLERWRDLQPQSITANIALAESYVGYAWYARGDGLPNTVSESGWRLFRERLDKAKAVLNDAASLPTKCPERYVAMQQVARGREWDLVRFKDLFGQAVAFEPAYDSYYRMAADYLQPKAKGAEGDAAIGTDGSATNLQVDGEPSPMATQVMKELYASYLKKEAIFPTPSKPHTQW